MLSLHRPPSCLASFPAFALATATAACMGLVACSPPADDPEPSATDRSSTEPAPTTAGETSSSKPEPVPVPAEPAKPAKPAVFDLVRKGDTLILSGTLRSSYQAEDIAIALQSLNGMTLDNQLVIDPDTTGVEWGNRISELLPDLAMSVSDLHFRIEKGVVTVAGKVASAAEINRLQRAIAYTTDSPTIDALKNELEVEAAEKGKGAKAGKNAGSKAEPDGEPAPTPPTAPPAADSPRTNP